MAETEKDRILQEGKATELLESEIEVELDDSVDIDESDKQIIREDAADEIEAEEIIAAEVGIAKKQEALKRARKKINPEAPASTLTQRPANGLITAKGEIHSRHAWGLLKGRKEPPAIAGLYAAAKMMNLLMREYRRGCLYAAKFLIDTEIELNNIKNKIELRQKENKKYFSEITRMKIEPFSSARPTQPEWVYFSPYSWHMTELVLMYDEMLRMSYPYYSMRLITREEFKKRTTSISRDLRRLFSMNSRYYWVGPESFIKKDEVYLQAVTDFGELNADIISRKVAPKMIEIPSQFL